MNASRFLACARQYMPLALVLLSALTAATAYLQALNYPFISDDFPYIVNNDKLSDLHITELWQILHDRYNPYEYLPLRDFSYWLDMTLFGRSPALFRIHNFILYLFSLLLVYGTTSALWKYFRPLDTASAPWAAAAVTALFTLHPAHVEAVVWASGRKDVLSTLFSLLAFWFAIRARQENRVSTLFAAAALFALLAALLSKATAIAVAPALAILWLLFWRDIPKSNRLYSTLLWPLASLMLATGVALVFAANSTVKVPGYFGTETVTRALAVAGWLFRLAVTPENRHYYYPVLEDQYLTVMVALGAIALLAAVMSGVVLLRKRSLECFAFVIFFLCCLPYTQLIAFKTIALVSDRFLALAVWAIILLLVALAWRLQTYLRVALLLAIALTWTFQTFERPRSWSSFETLIDTDLHTYPNYYMPIYQKIIGIQLPGGLNRDAQETAAKISDPVIRKVLSGLIASDYVIRVKAAEAGNPYNAMALLKDLEHLLQHPPEQAKWNPPVYHIWEGCIDVLETQWNYLARRFPANALARYNAGVWMLSLGHYKKAMSHLRAVTESQDTPGYLRGEAFKNLGLALLRSEQIAEAEAALLTALKQQPPDMQANCLLAEAYKISGKMTEATRASSSCPQNQPSDAGQK